jgi:hypothetical protein
LDNDTELKEYPSERRQNIANQKKFQRVKWILLVMVLFIAVRRDQLPVREIPQRVGQIHSGGIRSHNISRGQPQHPSSIGHKTFF